MYHLAQEWHESSTTDAVDVRSMNRSRLSISNAVEPDTGFLAVPEHRSLDAPSSRILKTGMLYKKGGFTGAMYNPRLFELRADGQLNYYLIDREGQKVKRGGIVLSASTKIEKRSGGKKRAAKFIIHHPLEDKEWYLWCNYPAVPASNENAFISLSDALKPHPKPKNEKHAVNLWPFQNWMSGNAWKGEMEWSESSDSENEEKTRPKTGREAAEEWCGLLSRMVSDCKHRRMCKTYR